MQVSRKADYGIRLLLELSMLPAGARTSTAEIAEKQDIPVSFLSKIARELAQSGLVRAYPGLGGGLELGRSAEDMTLLEALEALEGPVAFARCTLNPASCPRSGQCPVHQVWKDLEASVVNRLSRVTFMQIAQEEKQAQTS